MAQTFTTKNISRRRLQNFISSFLLIFCLCDPKCFL